MSPATTVFTNINTNKITVQNSAQDLSKLEIESFDVNMYGFGVKDFEEKIIDGLFENNKDNEIIKKIYMSYIRGADWIIRGLPSYMPDKDHSFIEANIKMIPPFSLTEYSGILTFKVRIFNDFNFEPLSELIINRHLGSFRNPTEEQIEAAILEKNSEIKKGDFYLEDLGYRNAKVHSLKYSGVVTVYYYNGIEKMHEKTTITNKEILVEAYNSTQKKSVSQFVTYDVHLGKEALLKSYNEVSLWWKGFTWNNANGNRWHNQEHPSGKKDEALYTRITLDLKSTTTKVSIMDRVYTGTNWTKVYGRAVLVWINNYRFRVGYEIDISAYATAWNAQWARTSASMHMTTFTLKPEYGLG
ncbi:hypothetical protein [Spiroplasma chinense]|uniref:hypothetical protein n=1 Tax=Spiroplasma chinense TaxID=216932 RepID=UPI001AA0DE14|nr:hypothetical protein [Spiroplasma chinense]